MAPPGQPRTNPHAEHRNTSVQLLRIVAWYSFLKFISGGAVVVVDCGAKSPFSVNKPVWSGSGVDRMGAGCSILVQPRGLPLNRCRPVPVFTCKGPGRFWVFLGVLPFRCRPESRKRQFRSPGVDRAGFSLNPPPPWTFGVLGLWFPASKATSRRDIWSCTS